MAEQRPTIATALCMAVREGSHLYLWSLSWGRGRTISVPAVENASLGQLRLASDAFFLHGLMVNCLDPELPQYRGWVTCTLQLPEVQWTKLLVAIFVEKRISWKNMFRSSNLSVFQRKLPPGRVTLGDIEPCLSGAFIYAKQVEQLRDALPCRWTWSDECWATIENLPVSRSKLFSPRA